MNVERMCQCVLVIQEKISRVHLHRYKRINNINTKTHVEGLSDVS